MNTIRIAQLCFKQDIQGSEITLFRGAINKLISTQGGNELFHNHHADGLRYAYPLVQYKSIDNHATIIAIGNAIEDLATLADRQTIQLQIGRRKKDFDILRFSVESYSPEIDDTPKFYTIKRYIPFTDDNYTEYNNLLALTDKIILTEKVLVGNILSFLKGIGFHIDEIISVAITKIESSYMVNYKGIKFLAFDLSFVTNIILPQRIGLGKSTSVGFGHIATTAQ